MITTLLRSQTLALLPNSRLNTPMVPGPQTSWVMRTSTFTHTLSPGRTSALPLARASSFSVKVIGWRTSHPLPEDSTGNWGQGGRALLFALPQAQERDAEAKGAGEASVDAWFRDDCYYEGSACA